MARVTVEDNRAVIVFDRWEAPFVGRRRLAIEREALVEATAVAHPMRMRLGSRAGLWITGVVKVGFFGTARRCLTSVRRGQPALHLRLREGRGFQEVLVGDAEAEANARALGGAR
ncbi:MAG TPA: hypothetical protein VFU12_17085 [Glycomyces sp.]|nr:hypothetical protein [Glycomyces sp.]